MGGKGIEDATFSPPARLLSFFFLNFFFFLNLYYHTRCVVGWVANFSFSQLKISSFRIGINVRLATTTTAFLSYILKSHPPQGESLKLLPFSFFFFFSSIGLSFRIRPKEGEKDPLAPDLLPPPKLEQIAYALKSWVYRLLIHLRNPKAQ